jgi:hypothetical protein
VRAVRHGIGGMLEYAGTIAEREKVPDPHFRNGNPFAPRKDGINGQRGFSLGELAGSLED